MGNLVGTRPQILLHDVVEGSHQRDPELWVENGIGHDHHRNNDEEGSYHDSHRVGDCSLLVVGHVHHRGNHPGNDDPGLVSEIGFDRHEEHQVESVQVSSRYLILCEYTYISSASNASTFKFPSIELFDCGLQICRSLKLNKASGLVSKECC